MQWPSRTAGGNLSLHGVEDMVQFARTDSQYLVSSKHNMAIRSKDSLSELTKREMQRELVFNSARGEMRKCRIANNSDITSELTRGGQGKLWRRQGVLVRVTTISNLKGAGYIIYNMECISRILI